MSDKQFHIHTHKAVSLRIDCFFLIKISDWVSGLRPAVVGLLASAALVLMNTENFSSPQEDMYSFIISIIIFLAAFIGTRKYKVNPILMIIVCGIAGLILY